MHALGYHIPEYRLRESITFNLHAQSNNNSATLGSDSNYVRNMIISHMDKAIKPSSNSDNEKYNTATSVKGLRGAENTSKIGFVVQPHLNAP